MVIDKGAHQGPIKTSCKNVLIGGFLAACKGDALTCSAHGEASIVEGSATVYINGRPAARKDDKTSCGTPPELTPPVGPQAAKDQYNFISVIPKDKSREDGTAKASTDHVDIKVLNAYANMKDKDKDGKLDYLNSGAVLAETTFKGDGYIGANNDTNLKGNIGFSVAKGEVNSGSYDGNNGLYGTESEYKASVLSGKAEGGIGDAYSSTSGAVTADVLYSESRVEAVTYTGGPDKRYGVQLEASTDEGAMRVEASGENNTLGIIKTKGKIGLMGGAGAIGGKGGYYLDLDDMEIGANVGGELALELGLKFDLSVAISIKPIWDLITGKGYTSVTAIPGVVLTGCKNVLIG